MCGRFSLSQTDGLIERFGVETQIITFIPRYNIAPTQEVLAVVAAEQPSLCSLQWGLIPHWAKDAKGRLINARAETVEQKPSFRSALQRRRCLVPADGFFEWKREGSRKIPYRFQLKNGGLFAFAALWDTWHSPQGERIDSCTILTTEPNYLVSPLHNRMPVILSPQGEKTWLDPELTDIATLKGVLLSFPAEYMSAYRVSNVVNSAKNDLPECIARVE